MKKYWMSPVGPKDDFGFEIEDVIIDGKTAMGPWALMTPKAFSAYGIGRLGLGLGQKYQKQDRWLKTEG